MASDEKQDAKVTKGMTSAQKARFKKADAAMDKKKPSRAEDKKKDSALAKKIKKGK